ncbi:MAG: CHASE4 domain-containing protein [Methanobacterium sp.]
MKLREKTLLLISITIVCSLALMYIASNVSLIGGFENLEKQNTVHDTQLAVNSVYNEISDLNGYIYDWAVWDDSYKFIQDNNSAYIQSNLVESTYTNFKLNFIIFIDNNGNHVYAKGFDLKNKEETALPEGIDKYLTKDSILLNSKGTGGIIQLSDGPALISSHPILPTDESGSSKGTLIFGRMLDKTELETISNKTQLSISIFNFNNNQMPADLKNTFQSVNNDSLTHVVPLNDSFIAGYMVMKDIYGNPALILRVENNRSFYEEYKNSLSFFLLSLLIFGCVLALTILIYLDRSILSRLSRLDKEIINIGRTGDMSFRFSTSGEDELSSLATSINRMLSRIEISQHKFKESELKFRSIVQLANDGIILADKNGKIIFLNESAQKMFGYGEEILGKSVSILLPDEYKYLHQKTFNEFYFKPVADSFESYGYKKDRSRFDIEISHTAWKIKEKNYYCAIVRDITYRKQTENQIKKSLHEKEAMLKEIHHRVKNNMQIVSSLLSLQSRYIKDREAASVFKESQNRVKSMALVHERLYQSEGLAMIDFPDYIKNLINELFRSYGVSDKIVKLYIDTDEIFLNADTAIPCGLIINELVTNSLKYAFNGDNGKICIGMYKENEKIVLSIMDNGKGLPEGFNLEEAETLGLRLVKSLVSQLNGTLELRNNNGAEFRIIFTPLK